MPTFGDNISLASGASSSNLFADTAYNKVNQGTTVRINLASVMEQQVQTLNKHSPSVTPCTQTRSRLARWLLVSHLVTTAPTKKTKLSLRNLVARFRAWL